MSPYPDYRKTPIHWLSKIPASWDTVRLKFLASTPITSGVGESGDRDDPDWPRYIRITDIAGPRKLRTDTYRSLPPAIAHKAPVEVDDILLAAVGATYGKSYLHTEDIGPACYAGYLVRVSPADDVDARFLAYWTESAPYWAEVRSQVVQATVQNFSAGRYRELQVPTPPIEQQRVIADFLDDKTARIDNLIAKKERLIELLEEKRTALITQAVTKGLDPDVPMKDSGVEWLGEIPEHWEVGRLRHITQHVTSGSRGWADYYADDGALFIRVGNLTKSQVGLDLSEKQLVVVPFGSEAERSRVEAGDLLLSITADIGSVAVADTEVGEAYVNQHVALVRPDADCVAPHWLGYLYLSQAGRAELELPVYGGTKAGLSLEDVKDVRVLLPPHAEQRDIVTFLEQRSHQIASVVASIERAISLLNEYRSALITAAVTGKIDVRDHAA